MQEPAPKEIWTVGHSTRSQEEFLSLLREFRIAVLVDVRNYPGSKRYPHFNKEALDPFLKANHLNYIHLKSLGGRRKPVEGSVNTAWRHSAFRGYADYMQGPDFKNGIKELEQVASEQRTAYMCSEAVWWSCHRALISDYLKVGGWNVFHIMGAGKATVHPYTSAARIEKGILRYDEPGLFDEGV